MGKNNSNLLSCNASITPENFTLQWEKSQQLNE